MQVDSNLFFSLSDRDLNKKFHTNNKYLNIKFIAEKLEIFITWIFQ